MQAFAQWKEVGALGENPRRHRENMQTPHGKAPADLEVQIQNFLVCNYIANHYTAVWTG